MKTLLRGTWMLVMALIFSGCATAPAPSITFLTHDELKTLMSGTRGVRWTRPGVGPNAGTSAFTPDGVVRLRWNQGSAVGKWRIEGNKLCTAYPEIRRGMETCYSLQKTGDTQY